MLIVVELWTDGACSGSQTQGKYNGKGPGGWAAVLVAEDTKLGLTGCEGHTTSNRMELIAVVRGLEAAGQERAQVTIYTDSAYVKNAFTQGWVRGWQENGWCTHRGHAVANQDLWEQLIAAIARHEVRWVKVKGHGTTELNNLVDRMAVKAKREQSSAVELLT